MGSGRDRDGSVDFEVTKQAFYLEVVLFLPACRKLPELHICEHSSAAPYGLGCLRTSIPLFKYLSDFELRWSSADLRFIN